MQIRAVSSRVYVYMNTRDIVEGVNNNNASLIPPQVYKLILLN